MRFSRLLLWGMVFSAGVSIALLAALVIWPFGRSSWDRVCATSVLVPLYFAVCLGCTVAAERGRAPRLMWSGVLVGLVGLVAWWGWIWFEPGDFGGEAWAAIVAWPVSWSLYVLCIGLLLLPSRRELWWRRLRLVTVVLLALLALAICLGPTLYLVLQPRFRGWEDGFAFLRAFAQISGALGALAGGGMLLTLLSAIVPGMTGRPVAPAARDPYWLRCPRCKAEQTAATGEHHCIRCGLRITVELR